MDNKSNLITTQLAEKMRGVHLESDKLVAPLVGIFDEPTRCYPINKEWAKIVMGMVAELAEIKLWQGAYDESHPAIAEILKFLEGGECVNCNDIEDCLNASPVTIAQATYTFAQLTQIQNERIAVLDGLYDDLTPQSVFPAIPSDPAMNDPDDDAALCYALYAFINLYAAGKNAAIESNDPTSSDWLDKLIEVGKFIWSPANYIAGAIWDYFTGDVDEPDATAALLDEFQREAFACCLKDELRQSALTETTWNAALASCAGTNDIGSMAVTDLANTGSFLYFLDVYNETLSKQSGGGDVYCPCDGWCVTFAGVDLRDNWYVVEGEGGVYANNGFESTHVGSGQDNRQQVSIRCDFGGNYQVRRIELEYDMVRGGNNNQFEQGLILDEPSGAGISSVFLNDLESGNAQKYAKNGVYLLEDLQITLLASRTALDPPNGKCRITRVTIRGIGADIPLGLDCWFW